MDNRQLFQTIREIAKALRAIGEAHAASILEEALSFSTVPGEILGETRFRLRSLPLALIDRANVRAEFDAASTYLDAVLG